MKINEGLRHHDLKGFVVSTIGCDYYESKIDESATVIHFKVKGRSQAEDFNRFVQKSYTEILDTEVSDACTPDGEYYVFVELPTNDKLGKALTEICADLTELCDISEWEIDVRKHGKTTVNDESGFASALSDFLTPPVTVVDSGGFDQLSKKHGISDASMDLSPESESVVKSLKASMGEGWDVFATSQGIVALHESTYNAVLLKRR